MKRTNKEYLKFFNNIKNTIKLMFDQGNLELSLSHEDVQKRMQEAAIVVIPSIWDEPYYAAYLNITGLKHPMRKEILEQGILNPEKVRSACIGKIPNGKSNYFQKHQTQHMLPSFDRTWIKNITNVFIIP